MCLQRQRQVTKIFQKEQRLKGKWPIKRKIQGETEKTSEIHSRHTNKLVHVSGNKAQVKVAVTIGLPDATPERWRRKT